MKAKAAAASKATVSATTVAAAAALVQSATKDAEAAWKASLDALAQSAAEQAAADEAKKPDKALVDKAAASKKAASDKVAEAAIKQAYLDSAQVAYTSIVAAVNALTPAKVCFPKGSRFDVTGVIAATTSTTNSAGPNPNSSSGSAASSEPTGSSTTTTAANNQLVSGHFSKSFSPFHLYHRNQNIAAPDQARNDSTTPCGDEAPQPVVAARTYEFSADQLSKNDFKREGLTWGGMVIPYKFYFTDKAIKSNSSIVGFVGYEGWFPGVSLATVLAAGGGVGSTAPNTTNTSGTSASGGTTTTSSASTGTAATYTVAVGLVATFAGIVKAGLMFGRDYQGNASQFVYENKTWMALSIGAGF